MAVAANANALFTKDELRGDGVYAQTSPLGGITGTDQDDMIQTLINRASDWVEAYCNRPFVARAYADLRLPAQCSAYLRPTATPIDITAALTVSLDGTAQTVWKSESDGDPALKDVVVVADAPGQPSVLYRHCGWQGSPPAPILLSYTGGYAFAALPGDLKDAALLVIQTLHRHWQNLAPYESMPAGASGGTLAIRRDHIPMAAIATLDRYRLIPV